ncbi:MAG: hypothetical protein KAY37_16530 [Phycisphaerae bacterium]|nr:hypothetical protein [Phycisphaerae bacterium]
MFDPVTFGQNIYLLIGLLVFLAIVIFVIIVAWTGINIGVWRAQKKNAEQQDLRRKFLPDGRPLPPTGRGVCTACCRACEKVYHLPTGERLCPMCFERLESKACAENESS